MAQDGSAARPTMPLGRTVLVMFTLVAFVALGGTMVGHVVPAAPLAPAANRPMHHEDAVSSAPPTAHAALEVSIETGDGLHRNAAGAPFRNAVAGRISETVSRPAGVWNAIPMLVNTSADDFTAISTHVGGHAIQLEAIVLRLRRVNLRVIRSLRLLWPQIAMQPENTPPPKRVWLDLGARFYLKGSTQWFRKAYPEADQFEVVAFDVLDLRDAYPLVVQKQFKKFEFVQKAVWVHDRGVEVKGKKMAHVKEKGQDDPMAAAIGNDTRATWTIESVDIASWLTSRYSESDFVVVKLDIEGGEWEVLHHLERTAAFLLIDELMLECHPRVPLASVDYLHQSCLDLVNHWRRLGVAAHRWV